MTTATGAEPVRLEPRRVPFSVALGFAVVATSAFGGAAPAYSWTTTPARLEAMPYVRSSAFVDQTSAGLAPPGDVDALRDSSGAQAITELRAASGLTTEQVARLLGVTRRTVHNWINGNAMAAQHEERLSRLLALVQALPGATPAERRTALLDSSGGESLFHRLLGERGESARTHFAAVSTSERIAP